jgi:hypothetical protein
MTNTKAIIGLLVSTIGAGLTAALAFAIPNGQEFIYLTIAAAVLTPVGTYFGVYGVANNPKVTPPTEGSKQ